MFKSKGLVRAGITAGLYCALSFAVFPIASGAVQIRLGDALCLLPLLFPETTIGLFVGCILTNVLTGCAVYDVIFGSLITLVAGLFTCLAGKTIKIKALKIAVGGAFPVFLNAIILPLVFELCYGTGEHVYIIQALFIFAGEAVSVWVFGSLAVLWLDRYLSKKGNK